MATTDRNGRELKKGDKVLVEMTVGDVFINAEPGRQIVLTADSPGAPPITLYTDPVHVVSKDDYGKTTGTGAEETVQVTAVGAPTNADGTLNTTGATRGTDGNWVYPDGTVRKPDGTVV